MKSILIKWLLVLVVTISGVSWNVEAENISEMLDTKQQSIVTIAAFTAKGDLKRLTPALRDGLNAGLTVDQIKEMLVHLYAYCGFPRSIRGLQTFMTVLDARKAKGIKDKWGAGASDITDDRSKYERGKAILEELTGVSQDGPKSGYAEFSPEIDVFLKEHLFADIFERDVLTYAEREIATVSALISLGGLEPMLRGHLNICLNVGLTPGQLGHLVNIITEKVGKKEADAARPILNQVLNGK